MNIFVLSDNPILCAQYHSDKHIVKMIVETAQLLSTAHRVLDGVMYIDDTSGRKIKRWKHPVPEMDNVLYLASHVNHPCAIWARENVHNYMWTFRLFRELMNEYTIRYGKTHKCDAMLSTLVSPPRNIKSAAERSEFAQAMPEERKIPGDAVSAYRNLYMNEKRELAVWKHTERPEWFV